MKREKGYVSLPCFTVELADDEKVLSYRLTCNRFLAKVWEWFFAPFWTGKITIYDESGEDDE